MPANVLTDRDAIDGPSDSGYTDDQHVRLPNDEDSDDDISFGIMEETTTAVYAVQYEDANIMTESDQSSSSSGFEAHEALELSDDDNTCAATSSSARVRPRKATTKAKKSKSTLATTSRTTRASSRNK